ncbi:MAG: D-mannonate oxidoreductase [Candidatus Glassbacteria bacterium RIFCSPLOWO2_12_FULL_58_11]|uniref:D-mannonate oxidoreductase n=2 Tax=Candidatus Glassiibacteriota TaxID=1817805 RepID=A0A1F5YPE4_9BACT|nr:MAG: D-mannonate oxidoreductase [Candidatus Glassbacteria bacterium GWA2_58_10]OGG02070.1 MAG: D-mannonate oxidoreductase [Candidatus Glassbacteria bacterium RIFCSPLOWO2_12_FULL_58_11]
MAKMFDISNKVIAITGAGGILCSVMAEALAKAGAVVAVLDLREDAAAGVAEKIKSKGGKSLAVKVDVLNRQSIEEAHKRVEGTLGPVDVLINGAGGNKKEATTSPELSFFDLPESAVRWVFDLNCLGTIMPSQIFCRAMAGRGAGNIVNISSMSAFHPLTKVLGYSAAKAAISNFTEWLAVHMAQNYSKAIRVNAIAPGFFLTEQNRFLLVDEKTGQPTERGKSIIAGTPMARYGAPEELLGALIWLISDASSFVTGTVIAVDGGFNAFGGV